MSKRRGTPYSIDLRERVLATMDEKGWTHKEAAEFFKIGEATIDRWSSLQARTGSLAPRPRHVGRERVLTEKDEQALRRFVEEKSDRTIRELRTLLIEHEGTTASVATIGRALHRLGYSLKKRRYSLRSVIGRTFRSGGAPS